MCVIIIIMTAGQRESMQYPDSAKRSFPARVVVVLQSPPLLPFFHYTGIPSWLLLLGSLKFSIYLILALPVHLNMLLFEL